MTTHSYISLSVPQDLNEAEAKLWYQTVEESAPEGTCVSTEIQPHNKAVRYYMESRSGMKRYVVVLSRDLSSEEAHKIAEALDQKFPEIDFEIDWSQQPETFGRAVELREDTLKAVALEASKRAHNRWVNEKINEGWRYGQKNSSANKVSPMCVAWENLSETYRRNEYKRMLGLLEVLNEMGMVISKQK
jgi:RyR domain